MRNHSYDFVVSVALLCTFLGCGGSGSSSSSKPPASNFAVAASTPQVSLTAGGSPITVSLAITGAGTVQVVTTGVPAGVTVSSFTISGGTASASITAASSTAPGDLYPDIHRNRFYAANAKRGDLVERSGYCPATRLLSEYFRVVSTGEGWHNHCYFDGHLYWGI